MDYKTFTEDLASYAQNTERIKQTKEELDIILYQMTGVKGIRYDKIPGTFNPHSAEFIRSKLSERYEEKENELIRYQTAVKNVELVKKRLPKEIWLMLVEKFVKNKTYMEIGIQYGYTNTGLWKYLRREVEKIL